MINGTQVAAKFPNQHVTVCKTSAYRFISELIRANLFWRVTSEALPLFMRAGDAISTTPLTTGQYEPQIKGFIEICSSSGFNRFMLDIGANIGLISCQTGKLFDTVMLFEPNELCANILRTNAAVSLDRQKYEIFNYGLGAKDEVLTLRVPKNNWGGAYVVSSQNSYSDVVLAKKDGFDHFDPANYLQMNVRIHAADQEFQRIFEKLRQEQRLVGVIKIDVEGLEMVLLDALARTVPPEFALAVVFENWGDPAKLEEMLARFHGRATLYSIVKTPRGRSSNVGKLLQLLMAKEQRFTLQPWEPADCSYDMAMFVAAQT
jgi:FkbM family methyltransferase